MKRRLSNFAAAVSLVLCLATIGLWVRSHRTFDRWRWRSSEGVPYGDVESWEGELGLAYVPSTRHSDGSWHGWRWGRFAVGTTFVYAWLGSRHEGEPEMIMMGPGFHGYVAYVPHWFLALASAALPTIAIRRAAVRALRSRAGRCRNCGYDLRATPERCPECGAVPALEPSGAYRRLGH